MKLMILAFSTNFCPINVDMSGTASVFEKTPQKCTIFGNFYQLLFTKSVNVARFACNVECEFLGDFQTVC